MPVTIENLTTRPVLLRLNSGDTLHLLPRMSSVALVEAEVMQNAKVEKLQAQNVIAVHEVTEQEKETAPARKKRTEAARAGHNNPAAEGEQ